jgi:hypothetical protein
MAQNKIKSADVSSKTGTGDTFVMNTSPEINEINLGHPSDTTITRISSGLVAVGGVNLIRAGDIKKNITWNVSGAGAAITTGGKDDSLITYPYAGTIVGWYITSKESATVTIDIWKNASSVPVNGDSITASAKVTLTAGQFNNGSTLTGWTTAIAAGDKFKIEVETNDNATDLKVTLIIE